MADQWVFVIAAYAVTAAGTVSVLAQSWRAMRNAEARVDALSGRAAGDHGDSA